MTQGKLACPIYMEDTKAFTSKYSGKKSRFDYHRRFLEVGKGLGDFQRLQKLENPLNCPVVG